ncbi:FtsK/SpoIIIE domain-containing protein [Gordonia sihwensis]|uniref:FtsK/SpoIIIE domain-containing protein n=1 Tax=Gordonia sihwensis TaxID=173559 RepID=UPI003D989B97
MTRDKQRKQAIRAEAEDRGVSYQTVSNEHRKRSAATAAALELPAHARPSTTPEQFSIGRTTDGAPFIHRGDIQLLTARPETGNVGQATPEPGLVTQALSSMMLTASRHQPLRPLSDGPRFVVLDVNASLVDAADALDRRGLLDVYAFDTATERKALEFLREESEKRRSALAAKGVKAMMTTAADSPLTIIVSNFAGQAPNLGKFTDAGVYDVGMDWWSSQLDLRFAVWATRDTAPHGWSSRASNLLTLRIGDTSPLTATIHAVDDAATEPTPLILADPQVVLAEIAADQNAEEITSRTDPLPPSDSEGPLPTIFGALGIDDPSGWVPAETWSDSATIELPIGHRRAEQEPRKAIPTASTPIITFTGAPSSRITHGLIQGSAESGRLALARAWAAALAASYSPEQVNLVFVRALAVDNQYRPFHGLPHTAGMAITADDPTLNDLCTALRRETDRRTRLTTNAELTTIKEHRATAGEPLPELFVFIDDPSFLAILRQNPDQLQSFIGVLRDGRRCGIHVLIFGEEFDQSSVGSDIWRHLDLFVTFRAPTSQSAVSMSGSPIAEHLEPGAAILRHAESQPLPFMAFDVNALHDGTTDLDILVKRITEQRDVAAARNILAPPFAEPVTWGTAGIPIVPTPTPDAAPAFRIGVVDADYGQARHPFAISVADGTGHTMFHGKRRSGLSTALASVVASAGVTYRPDKVSFYVIDMTGTAGLHYLSDFANVGAYATRTNSGLVQRILYEANRLIEHRSKKLSDGRHPTIGSYLESDHDTDGDPYGRLFVIIDRLDLLSGDDELLEQARTILRRGAQVGVHLIGSTAELSWRYDELVDWIVLSGADVDQLPTSLRHHREAMRSLPDKPGYFIADDGSGSPQTARIIVPIASTDCDAARLDEPALTATAALLNERASGTSAPRLHVVRQPLPYATFHQEHPIIDPTTGTPVLGINRADLSAVPARGRHLMIAGAKGSGRTNAVRLYLSAIISRFNPDEAQIYLVDPTLGLAGEVDKLREWGYIRSASGFAYDRATAETMAAEITGIAAERTPQPTMSAESIRSGDFWAGPQVFLVIDNYAFINTGSMASRLTSAFDQLSDSLAAFDNGIHVVLTVTDYQYDEAFIDGRGPLTMALVNTLTPTLGLSGVGGATLRRGTGNSPTIKLERRPDGEGCFYDPAAADGAAVIQIPLTEPWDSRG